MKGLFSRAGEKVQRLHEKCNFFASHFDFYCRAVFVGGCSLLGVFILIGTNTLSIVASRPADVRVYLCDRASEILGAIARREHEADAHKT